MWYYTKFEITYDGPKEAVREAKNDVENDSYENIGRYFEEESKWYDYDKDMIEFSRKHPEVTFTIYGDGEDSPDFWKHVFKNWKSFWVRGTLTYPEVTEEDLISPPA